MGTLTRKSTSNYVFNHETKKLTFDFKDGNGNTLPGEIRLEGHWVNLYLDKETKDLTYTQGATLDPWDIEIAVKINKFESPYLVFDNTNPGFFHFKLICNSDMRDVINGIRFAFNDKDMSIGYAAPHSEESIFLRWKDHTSQ